MRCRCIHCVHIDCREIVVAKRKQWCWWCLSILLSGVGTPSKRKSSQNLLSPQTIMWMNEWMNDEKFNHRNSSISHRSTMFDVVYTKCRELKASSVCVRSLVWCRENLRKINLFSYLNSGYSFWRGGYANAIIITNIDSHTKDLSEEEWKKMKIKERKIKILCCRRIRTGKRKTFAQHKLIEFHRIRFFAHTLHTLHTSHFDIRLAKSNAINT